MRQQYCGCYTCRYGSYLEMLPSQTSSRIRYQYAKIGHRVHPSDNWDARNNRFSLALIQIKVQSSIFSHYSLYCTVHIQHSLGHILLSQTADNFKMANFATESKLKHCLCVMRLLWLYLVPRWFPRLVASWLATSRTVVFVESAPANGPSML